MSILSPRLQIVKAHCVGKTKNFVKNWLTCWLMIKTLHLLMLSSSRIGIHMTKMQLPTSSTRNGCSGSAMVLTLLLAIRHIFSFRMIVANWQSCMPIAIIRHLHVQAISIVCSTSVVINS